MPLQKVLAFCAAAAAVVNAAPLPRVAFLIVAHDETSLDAAAKLLDAIYDADNLYLVHVDRKHRFKGSPTDRMAVFTDGRPNVQWGQVSDVRWGRWSMNEPTLWAMERFLESPDWEVFINLSGDTWPVLRPRALRKTLSHLKGLNFLTSSPSCDTGLRPTGRQEFGDGWHKKQAYPYPMLEDVPGLEAFYGSQWMVLSREFCEHVVSELRTPGSVAHKLRRWFVNGTVVVEGVGRVRPHIPDETFFPSVLMASPLRAAGRVAMRASFYVRMDEHYPWSAAKQRYSTGLERAERPWGPYYLGAYDLGDIRDHRALFVRKVSREVDANIFSLLPVDDYAEIPDLRWRAPGSKYALSTPPAQAETVTRGTEEGCVRVAESIHCPPQHRLGEDVFASRRRADEL